MNLIEAKIPTKEGVYYWVKDISVLPIFLGPYNSRKLAIGDAYDLNMQNRLVIPQIEVFLCCSKNHSGVFFWGVSEPRVKLTDFIGG